MMAFRPMVLLLASSCCLVACQEDAAQHMVGTLERDRVEITVESNEPISAIHVTDGERVNQGSALLNQDPARHQARLAAAQAQRDQAAARLAELQRGPRAENIAEARNRLAAATALTVDAKLNFERDATLFERQLGDAASRDRAQAAYDNFRAREQAERNALEALLNGTTLEELEQTEAALRAMEAAVSQAELDLQRLTLTAPVNGTVDKVWYEVGERPAAGATVAVVLDDARPYARIYVPAEWRTRIVPGLTVDVRVDGFTEPLQGTVAWVSADASFTPYFALTEYDRSRLSYLAEVDVPGAGHLPSGVPLTVTVP
jgi:HlyD family secretion protein